MGGLIETFELDYSYPQCLEVKLLQSATEIAIYSLHVYDTFFHISVQKAQLKYFVEIDTSESSGEPQFGVGSFAEDRGVECLKKRKYQLALLLALNLREFSTFY